MLDSGDVVCENRVLKQNEHNVHRERSSFYMNSKPPKELVNLENFLFSSNPLNEEAPLFTGQNDLIKIVNKQKVSPYSYVPVWSFRASLNQTFHGERNLSPRDMEIIAYALSVKFHSSSQWREIKTKFYELALKSRQAWKEWTRSHKNISKIIYKTSKEKVCSFPGNLPVKKADLEYILTTAREKDDTLTLGQMMNLLKIRLNVAGAQSK